jgi:pre-mRNA-splicing factor 18
MDLLQKELQRKKQSLANAKAKAKAKQEKGKKRKYMRNADIRRVEEKEEEERQRKAHNKRAKTPRGGKSPSSSAAQEATKESLIPASSKNDDQKDTSASRGKSSDDYSASSITKQLREFGLAIRYFGETHDQRIERLKEALEKQTTALAGLSEKEEFRLGKGHGIRNPFLGREEEPARAQQQKKGRQDEKAQLETKKENNQDDKDDPAKQIYNFFKGLLKQWEQDLTERPDIVARSVAGRNESKTLKQCKDYIRPLFKLCKSRKIEAGLQGHLIKIVNFAKEGQFVKAHDSYIDVAIGRAAWPIGVTMVGIHARSGREKIGSANVAHVMNSELQRKYLTSVKRLLTYAQKKRPDVEPSRKVA